MENQILQDLPMITEIESWETINSIVNSNINNANTGISELDLYFSKFGLQESQNNAYSKCKSNVQTEKLMQQIQEIYETNDKIKSEIDTYNKMIEQYGHQEDLNNSLKFKIRIFIRNNSSKIIKLLQKQKFDKKIAFLGIEERLTTKPIENLCRNINNISAQVVNSTYNNQKDRIKAIANQVNVFNSIYPSGQQVQTIQANENIDFEEKSQNHIQDNENDDKINKQEIEQLSLNTKTVDNEESNQKIDDNKENQIQDNENDDKINKEEIEQISLNSKIVDNEEEEFEKDKKAIINIDNENSQDKKEDDTSNIELDKEEIQSNSQLDDYRDSSFNAADADSSYEEDDYDDERRGSSKKKFDNITFSDEDDDEDNQFEMPEVSSVELVSLTVKVIEAKNLMQVNFSKKDDPCIILRLKSQKVQESVKTKTKKSTLNPVWKEKFTFIGVNPNDCLIINMYDCSFKNGYRMMNEIQLPVSSLTKSVYRKEFPIQYNNYKNAGKLYFGFSQSQVKRGHIIIHAYDAKNLVRNGIMQKGKPSTFLSFGIKDFASLKDITRIRFEDSNPVWNQDFILEVPDIKTSIFVIKLFDDYSMIYKREIVLTGVEIGKKYDFNNKIFDGKKEIGIIHYDYELCLGYPSDSENEKKIYILHKTKKEKLSLNSILHKTKKEKLSLNSI